MSRRVLVLGAAGQLGEAMAAGLRAHHDVVSYTRATLDVTSPMQIRDAIASVSPHVIVNCSAYTNVDGAEAAPREALAVNAWAVRSIARAADAIDATLVHFSTDFVFDGTVDRLHEESDAPNPRGVYAASKLIGEWFAAETPRHYVLRVESLFGGPRAKSSVDVLLDGIRAGRVVRAFSDRTVSPSYVEDVVRATQTMIQRQIPYGLYHCVNGGSATWLEVARELATLAGRPDAPIEAVLMAKASLVAPRPRFAALSNAKLEAAGVALPPWQDALGRYCRSVLGRDGSQ